MPLDQRIQTILQEQGIKQVEFAKALGISAAYVNLLVNGKKTAISEPLAMLIEERYGYSAQWILDGSGEKQAAPIAAGRAELIEKIQAMSDSDLWAAAAFVHTLERIKRNRGG